MNEEISPASGRATDDIETRRRRALWRATHRGTKEMDIMLGTFAAAELARMADPRLADFERLLTLPDPDLHNWIIEPALMQGSEFRDFIVALRAFHHLEPHASR